MSREMAKEFYQTWDQSGCKVDRRFLGNGHVKVEKSCTNLFGAVTIHIDEQERPDSIDVIQTSRDPIGNNGEIRTHSERIGDCPTSSQTPELKP